MDLSIPYYEDASRVSNSAIGWFLSGGPAYFRKKLDGSVDEQPTSAMERGTAIHMYFLQPKEFTETYVVWSLNKPQSPKQEQFCKELVQSTEIEPNKALLSAYRKVYSTTGQSDEKVLSTAQEIALQLKDYIEYLRDPKRTLISMFQYQQLKLLEVAVEQHKLAHKLINPTEGEWYHEFHINWEYKTKDGGIVPCKSLLDSVCFNFETKKVTLMDIKTTTKISHFEDSVNQYDYCRQLDFYTMAIYWYLKNERNVTDIDSWDISYYIVAMDTTGTNEVRVFTFTQKQVYDRTATIDDVINRIYWHTVNDKWDHTIEYYTGDGAETLSL